MLEYINPDELIWLPSNPVYVAFKGNNNFISFKEKFRPRKWLTDMATSNFNGLKPIYGDDVVEDVIGCEFHFRQSVTERKRKLNDEDGVEFERLAERMLTSATKTAYTAAYDDMTSFVAARNDLQPWLNWWHACRSNMFRAFTGQNKPYANQAEVIHASWVNRGEVGLTLRESAERDVTDAMMLEDSIAKFHQKKQVF